MKQNIILIAIILAGVVLLAHTEERGIEKTYKNGWICGSNAQMKMDDYKLQVWRKNDTVISATINFDINEIDSARRADSVVYFK